MKDPIKPDDSVGNFYVLLLNATAQRGCSRPQGSEHKIITIVAASSQDEAREVTLLKLAENHWSDVHIRKYGPLLVETAGTDYLRFAIADAREHGFGLVVYETKN